MDKNEKQSGEDRRMISCLIEQAQEAPAVPGLFISVFAAVTPVRQVAAVERQSKEAVRQRILLAAANTSAKRLTIFVKP